MVISEGIPDIQSDLEQSIITRIKYTNFRKYSDCKMKQKSQPEAR
jgi:hypothetical protein